MTLRDIKVVAISKGIKMRDLADIIGVSREYMYRQIKLKDEKFIDRIKESLKNHSHSEIEI